VFNKVSCDLLEKMEKIAECILQEIKSIFFSSGHSFYLVYLHTREKYLLAFSYLSLPILPPACISCVSTGGIFVKFDFGNLYENLLRK
jgi:hypothetical protein